MLWTNRAFRAAQAAALTGCPGTTINMAFSLYGGTRHLLVHGAVSPPCGGRTGLVAGCGFAVHFLRAFLPVPDLPREVTVRAYVDDFAVTAQAPSAWGVVSLLGSALPVLRTYMLSKGMATSNPKEQFYSPTTDVLDLWKRVHPRYAGALSKHTKDLGAAQRPVGIASRLRGGRVLQARATNQEGSRSEVGQAIPRSLLRALVSRQVPCVPVKRTHLPRSNCVSCGLFRRLL